MIQQLDNKLSNDIKLYAENFMYFINRDYIKLIIPIHILYDKNTNLKEDDIINDLELFKIKLCTLVQKKI